MKAKKTVLIIDDAADVRKLLSFHLEKKGYNVIVEENGEQGLEKIKQELPDLVVIDLLLPGMSGEEICRYIRNNEELKKMPVIMITAQTSDVKKIIGMVIGADSYIVKPIDIKKVLNEVNRLI